MPRRRSRETIREEGRQCSAEPDAGRAWLVRESRRHHTPAPRNEECLVGQSVVYQTRHRRMPSAVSSPELNFTLSVAQ